MELFDNIDILYLFQVETTTPEKVVQTQGNVFAVEASSPCAEVDIIGIEDFPVQSAIPLIDDKETVPVDSTEKVTPKALYEVPHDMPTMCTGTIEKNVFDNKVEEPEPIISPHQPSKTEGRTLETAFDDQFTVDNSAKVRTVLLIQKNFSPSSRASPQE